MKVVIPQSTPRNPVVRAIIAQAKRSVKHQMSKRKQQRKEGRDDEKSFG